jgi:selenocysteine lyase/cysteine desulfurase
VELPVNLADARTLFPGTQDRVFLDAACVSLLPTPAEEALRRHAQDLLLCPARDASAHHIALDATAEVARREAARLIGARAEDLALVESTTHGLEIVAAAFPLDPGDKVLVGATEFLGLAVPWIGRQQQHGFHIEVVPHRDGQLLVDDFARRIDGRTRLILVSSVQWNNGFRADLEALGQLARERGVALLVDAIQQLGAIGLNVRSTPVDFLVSGGHKWLNAPVGRGFLYIEPGRRARLRPPAWGYLNIAPPPEGWAEYFATPTIPAVRAYDFVTEARGFEIGGTANYPGNVVLGASLRLINDLGIDAIEQYILRLSDELMHKLQRVGATIVSPREPAARSGIVTFTMGQGPPRDTELLGRLVERRILISQRYTAGVGGLRVSVHFYNNDEDVMQLVDAVRKEAGTGGVSASFSEPQNAP